MTIRTLQLDTDDGYQVQQVGECTVVTFPKGKYEEVGCHQKFTFTEEVDANEEMDIAERIVDLLDKIDKLKEGDDE